RRAGCFGTLDGLIDIPAVGQGDAFLGHISAVNRKLSNDLGKSVAQGLGSEVAGIAVRKGNPAEMVREDSQLTVEPPVHNAFLAFAEQFAQIPMFANEDAVGSFCTLFACRINEESIHQIREVVAGGAVNWPVLR